MGAMLENDLELVATLTAMYCQSKINPSSTPDYEKWLKEG